MTRGCAPTTARVEAGAIRPAHHRTVSRWRATFTLCSIAGPFVVRWCWSVIQRGRSMSGSSPAAIQNRSREWSCSTVNRPKRWRAFRTSRPSTTSSVACLALLPSLARLGAARLFDPAGYDSLPAPARDRLRVAHTSARLFRSLRDEFTQLPTSLAQARTFQSLGDRPLIVVTATRDAMAGWLPLQDAMAALSTNSRHEVIPYRHAELVTNETAAHTSSQAIRDVVSAVRSATPLEPVSK